MCDYAEYLCLGVIYGPQSALMIADCCTLFKHLQVASLLASAPRVKEEPIDYSQGDGKCAVVLVAETLEYYVCVCITCISHSTCMVDM